MSSITILAIASVLTMCLFLLVNRDLIKNYLINQERKKHQSLVDVIRHSTNVTGTDRIKAIALITYKIRELDLCSLEFLSALFTCYRIDNIEDINQEADIVKRIEKLEQSEFNIQWREELSSISILSLQNLYKTRRM